MFTGTQHSQPRSAPVGAHDGGADARGAGIAAGFLGGRGPDIRRHRQY